MATGTPKAKPGPTRRLCCALRHGSAEFLIDQQNLRMCVYSDSKPNEARSAVHVSAASRVRSWGEFLARHVSMQTEFLRSASCATPRLGGLHLLDAGVGQSHGEAAGL